MRVAQEPPRSPPSGPPGCESRATPRISSPPCRSAAAFAAIAAQLDRLDGRPTPSKLVGMGGALTNLAAVRHGLATYDSDVVHGTVLDRAEIDRQITLYRTRTADERREIVGLQPGR